MRTDRAAVEHIAGLRWSAISSKTPPRIFEVPKFEIFICSEHGGDVYTIGRLHEIGLTGVSMSPGKVYRSIIKAAQCQVTNPRKSVK